MTSALPIAALALLCVLLAPVTQAQVHPPTEEVRFDQQLNAQVDLDLTFRDESGNKVTLAELMDGKPAVLSLVYYECPMLCTLVLNGMVECLHAVPYHIGDEFKIITVSFNAEETHVLAEKKKAAYLTSLGKPEAAAGWHFLVGEQEPIDTLCRTVGFSYKYVEETDEFAHRAGIVLLTPEGKVSRYFPGIQYEPMQVRLGLVEASEGKIGTLSDRLALLCYHYDPTVGAYGFVIMNLLRLGCFATVAVLGGYLVVAVAQERRKSVVAANA